MLKRNYPLVELSVNRLTHEYIKPGESRQVTVPRELEVVVLPQQRL